MREMLIGIGVLVLLGIGSIFLVHYLGTHRGHFRIILPDRTIENVTTIHNEASTHIGYATSDGKAGHVFGTFQVEELP